VADASIAGAPFSQAQILHLMKTEFSRARRHGYPLSCVLIKVDRLPAAGEAAQPGLREEVRQQLARLVAEKTRDHDHLGAIDDEGFLLVLSHTGLDAARLVAERIRQSFAALEIEGGAAGLRLSLSLGIASCEDRETLFFDTLLAQSELALEWAAEAGGDRVELFRKDRFVADGPGPAED
jgi:diguanylate cyclase (GGDEF)-like protein